MLGMLILKEKTYCSISISISSNCNDSTGITFWATLLESVNRDVKSFSRQRNLFSENSTYLRKNASILYNERTSVIELTLLVQIIYQTNL